jgi:large subunit ribosomal protein L22
MAYKYIYQKYDKEKMARAVGVNLPISAKHSLEIANNIRNKSVARAKKILTDVVELKLPVKYTKHNMDLAHKKGMGPGRYPMKTASHILKIVQSAEKNANQKGISNLGIIHIAVNKGADQWHYGRQRGRKMKRAHVEVVVGEIEKSEKKENKKEKERAKKEAKENKK